MEVFLKVVPEVVEVVVNQDLEKGQQMKTSPAPHKQKTRSAKTGLKKANLANGEITFRIDPLTAGIYKSQNKSRTRMSYSFITAGIIFLLVGVFFALHQMSPGDQSVAFSYKDLKINANGLGAILMVASLIPFLFALLNRPNFKIRQKRFNDPKTNASGVFIDEDGTGVSGRDDDSSELESRVVTTQDVRRHFLYRLCNGNFALSRLSV